MTSKIYTKEDFENKLLSIREKLADLEHEQWSHWEKYREERLNTCVDFSGQMANWRRLREKSYSDLTEKEKQSDREWADKVLNLLRKEFEELLYFATSSQLNKTEEETDKQN